MTCLPEMVDFQGDFYTGKVRNCTFTLPPGGPVEKFWYAMTKDGLPMQQGEGGLSSQDAKPPMGHLIWHDYNMSTFTTVVPAASVFEIPDICLNTTAMCVF